jgi:hypothetical protein
MSEIKIPKPKSHSVRLIAVASERVKDNVYNCDYLTDDEGNKYKILEHFNVPKTAPFPGGLMLIATGVEVQPEDIWGYYKKSDSLYFFIVNQAE